MLTADVGIVVEVDEGTCMTVEDVVEVVVDVVKVAHHWEANGLQVMAGAVKGAGEEEGDG